MKKVKFGAQVILLSAAFPVLFIAGITQPVKRTGQTEENGRPRNEQAEPKAFILPGNQGQDSALFASKLIKF